MGQRIENSSQHDSAGKDSFFEAQIRRRVLWQILWLDGRASQFAGQNLAFAVGPSTELPANLNDADIYPQMSEVSSVGDRATEMIFCLTRYEVGVFLSQNATSLHDTDVEEKDRLINEFENLLEYRYLKYCDPAVPLHRIAAGGARSAICKLRLVAHHPTTHQGKFMPNSEHDMIFATCVEMVELHTVGQSSKDIEKFAWHISTSFQLDAVVLMLIESQTQPPTADLTQKSWDLVAEVFKHHAELMDDDKSGLHGAVRHLVLKAWRAREAAARESGLGLPPPSTTISALEEIARRPGSRQSIFYISSTEMEGTGQADAPALNADHIVGASQGISNVMDEEINEGDDALFPDWDLMDISSWDRWNELLQA
jgi:hypothetical protein